MGLEDHSVGAGRVWRGPKFQPGLHSVVRIEVVLQIALGSCLPKRRGDVNPAGGLVAQITDLDIYLALVRGEP